MVVSLLLLVACGTLEVGLDAEPVQTVQVVATATEEHLAPEVTSEPKPSAAAPVPETPEVAMAATPTSEPGPSALWATYRDAAGFGYAFPCHWVQQGTTLVSYDEAFFMSRAIRGQWPEGDPPAGAVKLEIASFDYADSGIEAGTPLADAVPLVIGNDIVATDMVSLGSRDALRVQLPGTVFPSDTSNEIYFLQLSPTSMLLLSVSPRSALDSPDVQGIINSLALSQEEQVIVPVADPQGALAGRAVLADEAAGYCFQYPAEYQLEAFPPSGVPYAGDIVTLKLERPFYTLGLTASALPVGQQSSLDELVSQFIQGLPDDSGLRVERNPQDRVGGVDFRIGGEAAEFLEGVPGPEGSRDIFAKHQDRLYRLSFVPSTDINPQAEPELETFFLVVTTSFSFLP
jgi:hypothetical protein